jgi:hypothetical protein
MPHRRLTLIARTDHKPDRDWNYAGCHRNAVAFTASVASIRYALGAVMNLGFDIGRVIVDRAGTAEEFLELLTELPEGYAGDVLMIRDGGSGVLSATGRGGNRVLYSLGIDDVRFYLETQNLVTGRVALEKSA